MAKRPTAKAAAPKISPPAGILAEWMAARDTLRQVTVAAAEAQAAIAALAADASDADKHNAQAKQAETIGLVEAAVAAVIALPDLPDLATPVGTQETPPADRPDTQAVVLPVDADVPAEALREVSVRGPKAGRYRCGGHFVEAWQVLRVSKGTFDRLKADPALTVVLND